VAGPQARSPACGRLLGEGAVDGCVVGQTHKTQGRRDLPSFFAEELWRRLGQRQTCDRTDLSRRFHCGDVDRAVRRRPPAPGTSGAARNSVPFTSQVSRNERRLKKLDVGRGRGDSISIFPLGVRYGPGRWCGRKTVEAETKIRGEREDASAVMPLSEDPACKGRCWAKSAAEASPPTFFDQRIDLGRCFELKPAASRSGLRRTG